MDSSPVYLNSEHIEGTHDSWAFTVYNTLWTSQESILVNEKEIEVLHSCLTPIFQGYPVIVRKEYESIWQYTLTARARKDDCRGLVVYGQPGIGKSLFLLYALGHALQARISVAWCTNPRFYYLFDATGVSRRQFCTVPFDVLALFDTVSGFRSPTAPFIGRHSDSFVVHATSTFSQWSGWSTRANAKLWVMDVWNATEIEYLRTLKPTAPGYYDPVEVSTYLGPSAYHCAKDWKNTGNPTKDFDRYSLSFEPIELYSALGEHSNEDRPLHREHFHSFFFAAPNLSVKRPVNADGRLHITYALPTTFLRNLAFEPYCALRTPKLEETLRKFRFFPDICGAMCDVFALRKRWVFHAGGVCHFPGAAPFALPSNLTPARDTVTLSADTPPSTLWVAPAGYPTIDAVVVTSLGEKKCFTFLQMALAPTRKHEIKQISIQRIWANFSDSKRDGVEWQFVFVVPSEEIGVAVTAGWKEPLYVTVRHESPRRLRCKEKSVPVGYMVGDLPGLQDVLAAIHDQTSTYRVPPPFRV